MRQSVIGGRTFESHIGAYLILFHFIHFRLVINTDRTSSERLACPLSLHTLSVPTQDRQRLCTMSGADAVPETEQKTEKGEPINVIVKDQNGNELHFKVRKTTKFEKIMQAYCQKKCLQMGHVRFLYDGERVMGQQTPQEVDMDDGEVIDCVMEQLGGFF
ncbi:hypothetical protein BSKO_09697 [Bryopsis sp. KO-2023]|nr:hypothetical protein BSKO_09697 [Bryopsis sp. KO-2023]